MEFHRIAAQPMTAGLCSRVTDESVAAWTPTGRGSHRTKSQIRNATRICMQCPVLLQCVAYALVYAPGDDETLRGGLRRRGLQTLARMMRRDGLDMRRRKDGKADRYRQAIAWLERNPWAIPEARRQSLTRFRATDARQAPERTARRQTSPA